MNKFEGSAQKGEKQKEGREKKWEKWKERKERKGGMERQRNKAEGVGEECKRLEGGKEERWKQDTQRKRQEHQEAPKTFAHSVSFPHHPAYHEHKHAQKLCQTLSGQEVSDPEPALDSR